MNGSFKRVQNHLELDVSDNQLRDIPYEAFMFTESIRTLDISNNLVTNTSHNSFEFTPLLVNSPECALKKLLGCARGSHRPIDDLS